MSKGNDFYRKIEENISKVIVGRENTIKLLVTALVADGHVLLEDVPGTGKTSLAKALAKSINADFARIQFTPDLLPTDITGLNIFDKKENAFVFKKGPVFTNILLADEINRATPRTQSGVLECMEERQVTVDGKSYVTGKPFFVMATQNPVETQGTFPLPEAQMDRFLMMLSMGIPSKDEEILMLQRFDKDSPLDELKEVTSIDELLQIREEAKEVKISDSVKEYMVEIVDKTRTLDGVIMGVSPRGLLSLMKALKAYAYIMGRDYVTPQDVKDVAPYVLSHRIILGYSGNKSGKELVESILSSTKVPTEEF